MSLGHQPRSRVCYQTQPYGTLFFLIFTYLRGRSHWNSRDYGSNLPIYHFLKPETNKGDFRLYFVWVEKSCRGLFEVWFANIAPKMKEIKNTLRKQGFFYNFDGFSKFVSFGGNISTKTQQFYLRKKNLIFWHPWDPWGRIRIDLNKNSDRTGCVN